MTLKSVTLDDKYDLTKDRVFVSGTQAVVRLALMQKERDRRAGLNTGGYITGYRGSPLGGLDQQMGRSRKLLKANDIVFQPGLNEDLAATALWGSQQAEIRGEGAYDGVFGIWYGKGPGVDRTGDVFRHANFAGTSPNGGVIALMGDDHTCESSTTAHQSEFMFVDVMMPILNPAGVQEILDFGLHGWALSRYAGVWTGLKCLKDTIESTASVDGAIDRVTVVTPDFALPPDGLNIRPNDHALVQEARLHDYKRDAILAYVRANGINRIVMNGGKTPRLGIITTGKSYLDVLQAFADLGIDEVKAADLGIRLFKIGCPWPLLKDELIDFAEGLERILVVEEKRSLIEVQVREELYGTAHQPIVEGKFDEGGEWLFPVKGALDPNDIAVAIGDRVLAYAEGDEALEANVRQLRHFQKVLTETQDVGSRTPYFCAGCPHNSSTVVPDGSRAYAGIGCHYMVQWMDRETEGFTQMGGEGANWIGEAPFSKRGHVFQNLGDGTYNHSGALAIRAAHAAGVNITYKILYNDAVAMTGGQPHEGGLTVPDIAAQVAAEGARKVIIVTDEPDKYPSGTQWPTGTTVHHRDELMSVQEDLAEIKGLSVLIYDQTCAAEKRRRRKRGTFPDPDKRVIINELVCEGCGDCGVQSNCVAIQPVETEYGRKRQIDQSSCNKDFSCLKGFCPSFVTVHGGKLKTSAPAETDAPDFSNLPEPAQPAIDGTYNVVVTGVGGTGVVTIGAVMGMATHLEGKGIGIIDMAGLAQKGGAVLTHLKIGESQDDIEAIRVSAGSADLVLGCDIVVAGTKKVLASVDQGRTEVLVNTHEQLPGDFAQNADYSLPTERLKREITRRAGQGKTHLIDATRLATALMGNSIMANIFMLGYAVQHGRVPLSVSAIEEAIRLNGAAVQQNLDAFRWGRLAAVDRAVVEKAAEPKTAELNVRDLSQSLDDMIARRVEFLTSYQNASYARRYQDKIAAVRAAEEKMKPDETRLTEAVARYLFKLMAIKDEYEVARLYTDGSFRKQVASQFESYDRLEFHMAPPLLSQEDPRTGRPQKIAFGPWMLRVMSVLAALRGMRGSAFDIFGRTAERRMERQLLADYEAVIGEIIAGLNADKHALAVGLASVPEKIRGYGHVKEAHVAAAKADEAALLEQFRAAPTPQKQAAE